MPNLVPQRKMIIFSCSLHTVWGTKKYTVWRCQGSPDNSSMGKTAPLPINQGKEWPFKEVGTLTQQAFSRIIIYIFNAFVRWNKDTPSNLKIFSHQITKVELTKDKERCWSLSHHGSQWEDESIEFKALTEGSWPRSVHDKHR